MGINRAVTILAAVTLSLVVGLGAALAAEAPRMTVEDLKEHLGDASFVILDVRSPGDWQASDQMIPGAIRKSPAGAAAWARDLDRSKTIVLYCA